MQLGKSIQCALDVAMNKTLKINSNILLLFSDVMLPVIYSMM